jgi:hypothetical protein
MAEFYVTKEPHNDTGHQVHRNDCGKLPVVDTLRYLGSFATAQAAINKANGIYSPVTECPGCLISQ